MTLVCKRCNHKWAKRTHGKPVQCPACKSPRWNVNRKPKEKPHAQ